MLNEKIQEREEFLKEQIPTYLGNKRRLLEKIEEEVVSCLSELGKDKAVILDAFSGSGAVARLLKQYATTLYTNDLEPYTKVFNDCYLTNEKDFNVERYNYFLDRLKVFVRENTIEGPITSNYAPKDDNNIMEGERVFYTHRNAQIIDTIRYFIEYYVPNDMVNYFIAPLIYEASVHNNTSGVFKGFYKKKVKKDDNGNKTQDIGHFGGEGENSLDRILGEITIKKPVFSAFDCITKNFSQDINKLVKTLPEVDIAYLDPPYNQHPYGSNYHMFNNILNNYVDSENISKVAGIPNNWSDRASLYNKKQEACKAMDDLIKNIRSKYIIISYNNEGFITYDEMSEILSKYGDYYVKEAEYPTFRGGMAKRNNKAKMLSESIIDAKNYTSSGLTEEQVICKKEKLTKLKQDKAKHVKEYIFVLKKN